MKSIGFDFGEAVQGEVRFKVPFEGDRESIVIDGAMTRHHMIGDVARMRIDLNIPTKHFIELYRLSYQS